MGDVECLATESAFKLRCSCHGWSFVRSFFMVAADMLAFVEVGTLGVERNGDCPTVVLLQNGRMWYDEFMECRELFEEHY
jgi:hypothetical protein